MNIRQAKPEDCRTINTLMGRLIEEIYAYESEDVRKHLKDNFTQNALRELCSEEQAHLYVAVKDRKIVAFLMGWIFQNIFTMQNFNSRLADVNVLLRVESNHV